MLEDDPKDFRQPSWSSPVEGSRTKPLLHIPVAPLKARPADASAEGVESGPGNWIRRTGMDVLIVVVRYDHTTNLETTRQAIEDLHRQTCSCIRGIAVC